LIETPRTKEGFSGDEKSPSIADGIYGGHEGIEAMLGIGWHQEVLSVGRELVSTWQSFPLPYSAVRP